MTWIHPRPKHPHLSHITLMLTFTWATSVGTQIVIMPVPLGARLS